MICMILGISRYYQDLVNNREEAQNVRTLHSYRPPILQTRVLDYRDPVLMSHDLAPPTSCSGCILDFIIYIAANSIATRHTLAKIHITISSSNIEGQ